MSVTNDAVTKAAISLHTESGFVLLLKALEEMQQKQTDSKKGFPVCLCSFTKVVLSCFDFTY